jgi:hypothetical protein
MPGERKSYQVFLKRRSSRYHMIPEDWQNKVRMVDGVEIIGASPRQLQIEADDAGIAEVIKRVRAHCEVEPNREASSREIL